MSTPPPPSLYFSEVFAVDERVLERYGAFNVSLANDLPLFVDPFLLFGSKKSEYRQLHDEIIRYLQFLRDASAAGNVSRGLLDSWYRFPEVKQTWLGFSVTGNAGRGLGRHFSQALDRNLANVFRGFGDEQITLGSHLEKLCLVDEGVGRDMVSDFTTNLIKEYLLTYTDAFTRKHISAGLRARFKIKKVYFDYATETWMPKEFDLPTYRGDYVVLTPTDILTKDDTWICRRDMFHAFNRIPDAVQDRTLRDQINRYFRKMLPRRRRPKAEDLDKAKLATLQQYPLLIDYFIRSKEDTGDEAFERSRRAVAESQQLYVVQFQRVRELLSQYTAFYSAPGTTADETRMRIGFFKDIIENKGGYKALYRGRKPIAHERDAQLLFRFVWSGTTSDLSREPNDGRGPVDYKASRSAADKTLIEFKLASNSHLKRNIERQLPVYQSASDAQTGYMVIIYFTKKELTKVQTVLKVLKLTGSPHITLVDARADNKPTGSRA